MQVFFRVFSHYFSTAAFACGIFNGFRHRNKFVHQIVMTQGMHASSCNMIFMILVRRSFHAFPHRCIGLTVQTYFVLRSSTVRQVSLYLSRRSLQGIAAGIGISNFLRAFSIIRLNSPSSGSIKKRPSNLLALSSLGSRWPTFAFLCVSMHQTYASTLSGHTVSGLEVVCFLVNHSPNHSLSPSTFK